MLSLVSLALAAPTALYDGIGVAGLAAIPVGAGLVTAGELEGDAAYTWAGVSTAMAAPPLLATSALLQQVQLRRTGVRVSAAPVILTWGLWLGAGVVLVAGTANPEGAGTSTSLATLGLWGASCVTGTIAEIQVWEARGAVPRAAPAAPPGPTEPAAPPPEPAPSTPQFGVIPWTSGRGGGLTLVGTF